MSRSVPETMPESPALVDLIQYGILGGIVGLPVSVALRDFPPDLVGGLWRGVAQSLKPEHVVEVWTQADIRQLRSKLQVTRVVLVYPSHGGVLSSNILDWMITIRHASSQPLPAVLSIHHRNSPETPGATLVAQGDDQTFSDLSKWLAKGKFSALAPLTDEDLINNLSIDTSHLWQSIRLAAAKGLRLSVRDTQIFMGILKGVTIKEAFQEMNHGGFVVARPEHYAETHRLLNLRLFRLVDHPHDDLTLQMIARANAYIKSISGSAQNKPTPLAGRTGNTSTLQAVDPTNQHRSRPITRRELVDLGNARSDITKELVETLVQTDQRGVLKQIGIRAQDSSRVRQPEVSELLKSLPSWTYKMVRTRFDRLLSEGLIEIRKTCGNAAIEYVLPEELIQGRSPFSNLPDPKEVEARYQLT